MDNAHILIVEDETSLANLMAEYLQQSQFNTTHFENLTPVLNFIKQVPVDLILLDLNLPDGDGLDLCQTIRQFSDVPILIMTARVEEIDRLLGLQLGADDYVCKPFSPREVVARVKAILKRTRSGSSSMQNDMALDAQKLRLSHKGITLDFTHIEFAILNMLFSEPGRIFSREQIMQSCYDDHRIVSDRTIDSHMKKLRQKLKEVGIDEHIHSVYGVGYRYEKP